jgi:2-aminobenzoate-CoA ligase
MIRHAQLNRIIMQGGNRMGKIPEKYLPPKDTWPEYIVPDEFADTPMKVNLADFLLDRHVREGRGDNPAIKFMDKTLTYKQVQQMVNKFGNSLKKAGVEPQDRVGIRLVNAPPAIVAIFAIEKIGAIPVPTSPLWSGEEVAFVANDSEMKFFIVNAPLMEAVEKAKPDFKHGTKVIVIGGEAAQVKAAGNMSYEEMVEGGSPDLEATMLDAGDIGIMLYTSGTTGMPKGCVHFVRNSVIEAKVVNKYVYKMKPGDVLGGAAPVSFAAGFGTFTLLPFEGGAAISLIPKFAPADMMELISKHKITVLTGLPTAYRGLMKFPAFKNYDVSSIRMYTSGGDALGAETLAGWQELTGKPIWEGLGGTEMLHLVTSNTMNAEPVPNSIGKALPGVQVKVVDAEGNECKPGDIGSMLLKGPSGSLYWKPYENNEKLLKSQKKGVVNGWNQMGDAVYKNAEGNIFFVSREDDMIKSSGYRIGPAEVEEAIAKHPAVADVGVVGVPDPDKGQITKAFVVLKPGKEGGDEFFEELKVFLKDHIAVYKLPRALEYVESLPRTPTGKLLRRKLR